MYTGRIATLGEEVKNPTGTLPLSILLALTTSVIIYVLTGFTATGLQDLVVSPSLILLSWIPLCIDRKVFVNLTCVTCESQLSNPQQYQIHYCLDTVLLSCCSHKAALFQLCLHRPSCFHEHQLSNPHQPCSDVS